MLTPQELIAVGHFKATVLEISAAENAPELVASVLLRVALDIIGPHIEREDWMALAAELWDGLPKEGEAKISERGDLASAR